MRAHFLLALLVGCSGIETDPRDGELVMSTNFPRELVTAGRTDLIYFATYDGVYVFDEKYPLSSSNPSVAFASGNPLETQMAADDEALYIVSYGVLYMLEHDSVDPRPLGNLTPVIRRMAVDATSVYVSDDFSIRRFPKDGSLAPTGEYFGNTDLIDPAIALTSEGLWGATLTGAQRINSSEQLRFSEIPPDDLVAFGDQLFATFVGTGDNNGGVMRVPDQFLAADLVLPSDLEAAEEGLYVVTGNADGQIRRIPHEGGGSEAVAIARQPTSLTITSNFVYWADASPGEIRRIPR